MKYIDTVIRLKPVADKAKSGFKLLREGYAKEPADEIAEYNKAVRYLKANQMSESGNLIQDDLAKYEARRDALLKEIARTEEKLRAADLAPEIIRTIRYQVEKVTESESLLNTCVKRQPVTVLNAGASEAETTVRMISAREDRAARRFLTGSSPRPASWDS